MFTYTLIFQEAVVCRIIYIMLYYQSYTPQKTLILKFQFINIIKNIVIVYLPIKFRQQIKKFKIFHTDIFLKLKSITKIKDRQKTVPYSFEMKVLL